MDGIMRSSDIKIEIASHPRDGFCFCQVWKLLSSVLLWILSQEALWLVFWVEFYSLQPNHWPKVPSKSCQYILIQINKTSTLLPELSYSLLRHVFRLFLDSVLRHFLNFVWRNFNVFFQVTVLSHCQAIRWHLHKCQSDHSSFSIESH